ncbi:MAG: hypothetical protein ACM3ZE_10295 [Myxococcales bacterium]
MTDPARLLKSDATEFERLLLGAAALERPSRLQQRRMRRAIGLAQLGVFATTAQAIAGMANQVVVVAIAATALAGSGSTPRIDDYRHLDERSRTPASLSTERESLPAVHPSPATAPSAETEMHETELQGTEHPRHDQPKAAASSQRLPDLREEIALIDRARTALRSGAPGQALSALDQYRARYPRGTLGQEARGMRIEALAASGNRARALAETSAFLSQNPKSPHSERLRQLLPDARANKR